MNPTLEKQLQAKAKVPSANFNTVQTNESIPFIGKVSKEFTVIGKTQYPRTLIDWNTDTLPPSNFEFNAIIKEPIQIITKIEIKTLS